MVVLVPVLFYVLVTVYLLYVVVTYLYLYSSGERRTDSVLPFAMFTFSNQDLGK